MVSEDGKNFGKTGNYIVSLYIGDDPITSDNVSSALKFRTGGTRTFEKGEKTIAAGEFSQENTGLSMEDLFKGAAGVVKDEYQGSYKTTYYWDASTNITEYVDFTTTSFSIYEKDTAGNKNDYLDFVIEDWEFVSKEGYKTSFYFKGYIKDGKPINTNIYGSKTAPNFTQVDIDNKTPAYMYLYFKDDGTFVRTAFSKTNAAGAIITGENSVQRVYTKL